MHESIYRFVDGVVDRLALNRPGLTVVDLGSLDVNGSTQPLFARCDRYIGVDIRPGPGVDVVSDAAAYMPDQPVDVVVSTSALEHAPNAADVVATALRILKPGGVFLGTCATFPWPEHGPDGDTLQPDTFYANVPPAEMYRWLARAGARADPWVGTDTCGDLYFIAHKPQPRSGEQPFVYDDARPSWTDYPLRLDIGNDASRPPEGYIRIDAQAARLPDIVARTPPIPLQDASCSRIRASHVIEHLTEVEIVVLMAEIWRVLVPGGKATFSAPYAMTHGAFQDLTHRSFIVPETFLYFTPTYRHLEYGWETRFRAEHIGLSEDKQEVQATLVKTSD